jgi:hypothetical protein
MNAILQFAFSYCFGCYFISLQSAALFFVEAFPYSYLAVMY